MKSIKREPPIAALDHRLAAIDRLIDRVVYALYGLSDDEIAIVEGKSGYEGLCRYTCRHRAESCDAMAAWRIQHCQ